MLIVHQSVVAFAVKKKIMERQDDISVDTASFFYIPKEISDDTSHFLKEEDDFKELVKLGGYDVIAADSVLSGIVPDFDGIWIDFAHFALSGRQ